MAVGNEVPPSPPLPPARVVVLVLGLVRFALVPMLTLGHVFRVAGGALSYLVFAVLWVISAASAAQFVARRAWGEASAPFLVLEAFTNGAFEVLYSFLVLLALLLCSLCVAYMIALLSGFGSEFKKRALGATTGESAANLVRLPRTVVLGFMTDAPFFLLAVTGLLVVMMSHVDGSVSQGEMVGFVFVDVGIFAMHVIFCFLIIPSLALTIRRDDQADRKATLQFC